MRVRRLLSFALFAVIAVASINPLRLELIFTNREMVRRVMTTMADNSWWPDYPAFLDDVRKATAPGDTIAIVVPGMSWDNGYAYAYYRASYFLAGRQVLPVITPANARIESTIARTRYVAAWRTDVTGPWRLILRSHHGVLLVRSR